MPGIVPAQIQTLIPAYRPDPLGSMERAARIRHANAQTDALEANQALEQQKLLAEQQNQAGLMQMLSGIGGGSGGGDVNLSQQDLLRFSLASPAGLNAYTGALRGSAEVLAANRDIVMQALYAGAQNPTHENLRGIMDWLGQHNLAAVVEPYRRQIEMTAPEALPALLQQITTRFTDQVPMMVERGRSYRHATPSASSLLTHERGLDTLNFRERQLHDKIYGPKQITDERGTYTLDPFGGPPIPASRAPRYVPPDTISTRRRGVLDPVPMTQDDYQGTPAPQGGILDQAPTLPDEYQTPEVSSVPQPIPPPMPPKEPPKISVQDMPLGQAKALTAEAKEALKMGEKMAADISGQQNILSEIERILTGPEKPYGRPPLDRLKLAAHRAGLVETGRGEATSALEKLGTQIAIPPSGLGAGVSEGDRKAFQLAYGDFAAAQTAGERLKSVQTMRRILDRKNALIALRRKIYMDSGIMPSWEEVDDLVPALGADAATGKITPDQALELLRRGNYEAIAR